ncbi:cilia- and flagella-associated protein 99 [Rana temporaria]|uniref:cilia- and flagella-associated protein 99 n=1 Tax=Rana temporaria TaxID=8407 RepID=UPI001AADCE84|nr:cilia- and flagella-associated protein 99 [Rana temporaria]XP_040191237.1 cilia- and flagella-associated protein 99 [Rana temporaria]
MANYGRCINLIAHLLNKYNPENQGLEHFLEDSAEDLQKLNDTEKQFVLEVLSGCVQYTDLLDIVVDAFYARDGKNSLKSEHALYLVFCYITTFKLEEYGILGFSRIIKSQDVPKMGRFLRFFLDHLNLNTWIKDEWSQIYDSNYVKENWIIPLLNWQPEVLDLIDGFESKSVTGSTPVKSPKVTEVKEFNLTKPKPRTIPVPQRIPSQKPHQPVPESTFKTPKEQEMLQEKKLKNRQKAEELLIEANVAQFKCANAEKSEKTKRVLSEIMKEEDNKLAFNKTKAQQVSLKKVDNVPVKLNATAILREGALYQRQVEKELRRIEKLVDGARDPSEFLEWQRQMREKDLERQLAEIECRRLEGKLSREEAVLARQNLIQENKKKAVMKKEEAQKLMRQYAEKRLQEEREMRDLVEQVSEGRKNTKQARLKLQKYKQRIVQEVTVESRELLQQALEDAEEELKKKFELIREIRAMESVPIIRHKFVDLTETAGHGLNCEMSIAELHERLSLLKEAERKSEEEKRDQILEEKQTKQQILLDTLEQISLHRTAMGKAALLKSEEKKAKSQFGKAAVAKDDRVTELQKKLEEKITERKRQAEALKLNPQRNIAKSSKNSFEEKHWKELEESRERQAQLFQHGAVSRETANRIAAYQAARSGVSPACLLQS